MEGQVTPLTFVLISEMTSSCPPSTPGRVGLVAVEREALGDERLSARGQQSSSDIPP